MFVLWAGGMRIWRHFTPRPAHLGFFPSHRVRAHRWNYSWSNQGLLFNPIVSPSSRLSQILPSSISVRYTAAAGTITEPQHSVHLCHVCGFRRWVIQDTGRSFMLRIRIRDSTRSRLRQKPWSRHAILRVDAWRRIHSGNALHKSVVSFSLVAWPSPPCPASLTSIIASALQPRPRAKSTSGDDHQASCSYHI